LPINNILPVLSSLINRINGVGCNVSQWAHPYTENILVLLNNEDHTSFSKDFNESLKAEIAQENFPEVLSATIGVFGKYIEGSKKMFSYNF
jgi:hypothetical protein